MSTAPHSIASNRPTPFAEPIDVLAFDVFGTVVDWHGSIVREMRSLYPDVDGDAFALAWRAGYVPAMARVMRGELGWMRIDDLHRLILDEILPRFGLAHLDEEARRHLNTVWHRLDPWPDAVEGLQRLKRRAIVCSLSNGNIGLLTRMAKRAGLPWDCVLSAEVFHAYKPDPRTYLGVANLFDVPPERVMMVATHQDDLDAARSHGLRTAFVERPLEYGAGRQLADRGDPRNTLHATSITQLADLLGC